MGDAGMSGEIGRAEEGSVAAGDRPTTLIDPVCGMTVSPETKHRFTYRGQVYGFCGARCLERFQADPEKYLGGAGPGAAGSSAGVAAASAAAPAIYTCPMHPEVRQPGPG